MTLTTHGDTRVDEWYWLRERDDPDVIAYLESENDWAANATAHTEQLQEDLFEEIKGRIQETDVSAPVAVGPWWYYTRTEEGRQYGIHCRRLRTGPREPAVDADETYTLRVRDLDRGEDLLDVIPNTYYGLEWANDNRTLFYTVLDDAKRPWQVRRHILGEDASADALVYEEADEAFHVGLGKTRSKEWILIVMHSMVTSEARVV